MSTKTSNIYRIAAKMKFFTTGACINEIVCISEKGIITIFLSMCFDASKQETSPSEKESLFDPASKLFLACVN